MFELCHHVLDFVHVVVRDCDVEPRGTYDFAHVPTVLIEFVAHVVDGLLSGLASDCDHNYVTRPLDLQLGDQVYFVFEPLGLLLQLERIFSLAFAAHVHHDRPGRGHNLAGFAAFQRY